DALDRAAEGRTTLVIAHRLSTIRSANKIIVIQNGEVVEEGDHELLMRARGTYFALVEQQNLRKAEEKEQLTIFEKQESIGSIGVHPTEEIQSSFTREHSSIIASSPLSIINTLYGKVNNSTTGEYANIEEDIEIKNKKVKSKIENLCYFN
ncbi:unnamed protein product, partial [Rotaria sordida]